MAKTSHRSRGRRAQHQATISFILEMEGFGWRRRGREEGLEKIRALKTAGCAFGRHDAATDGFDVCRTVKGDPALASVKVIMLTQWARRPTRRRDVRRSGLLHYKPFDEEELLALLRRLTA